MVDLTTLSEELVFVFFQMYKYSDNTSLGLSSSVKSTSFNLGETFVFKDSITSPKLISVKVISYEPSGLNVQLKLDTLANKPS